MYLQPMVILLIFINLYASPYRLTVVEWCEKNHSLVGLKKTQLDPICY